MSEKEETQKPEEKKPAPEKPVETKTSQDSSPAAPKKDEEKIEKLSGKAARPKECVVCSKNIQKLWYYRDEKYYCTKGCWKRSKKESEKPKEEK
ncbi:MAG: hypothetical protein ABIH57_03235 [Candidatus Omnitrophota bacterium]